MKPFSCLHFFSPLSDLMTVFLFVCFFRKNIAEGIDVIYIPCLISLVSLIMPAVPLCSTEVVGAQF